MIRAPAHDARAEPLKIRAGRRSVRLAGDVPRPVGRQKLAEIFESGPAHARAAMRKVVRPHEHLEIFFGIDLRTSLQQRDAQAAFGENLRRHAAARAGANYTDIISFRRTRDLCHPVFLPDFFYAPNSSLRTFF